MGIVQDRLAGLSSSVAVKGPCRVSTTEDITLQGLQTIDGVALATNDRVLVKSQTDAAENGIYFCDTGPWVRAADFSRNDDLVDGTLVIVSNGNSSGLYQTVLPSDFAIGNSDVSFIPIFPYGTTIYAAAYGVVADGVTDDTDAMDRAFVAADVLDALLVLPAGQIVYNGSGWNSATPQILGDSQASTMVLLGSNSRLIDSSVAMGTLWLERVRTSGGKGAIRNTFSGVNVAGKFYVQNCEFLNYTSACIETNADDQPCWTITGNSFKGANYTTSIGIALRGWADTNYIVSNDFQKNKIHLKIGRSGQNCYIHNNDFLRIDAGTDRIDVWVVPVPSSEFGVSGQGFVMSQCKFGNELLDDSDIRVLYADEGSGATFGERFPVFTESAGYITGHTIRDCTLFSGAVAGAAWPGAFVTTTTPFLFGCEFSIKLGGSVPSYLVEYLFAPTANVNNQNNVFGPVLGNFNQFNTTMRMKFVSHPGTGRIVDPTGMSDMYDHEGEMPFMNRSTASFGGAFLNLITAAVTSAGVNGSCAKSTVADQDGGTNCARGTFTAADGNMAIVLAANPVAGVPLWVEFDLGPGPDPVDEVKLSLNLTGSPFSAVYQEHFKVPAATRRIRRMFVPRSTAALQVVLANVNSEAGTVDWGRLLGYQSREPVGGGVQLLSTFRAESYQVPGTPTGGIYEYVQAGNKFIKSATSLQEIAGRGRYYYSSTVFDGFGSGSPEGVITGGISSTWRRVDGGANTSFYVKESGTGNTGWTAK